MCDHLFASATSHLPSLPAALDVLLQRTQVHFLLELRKNTERSRSLVVRPILS